jgi:toxin ParE1/3/4
MNGLVMDNPRIGRPTPRENIREVIETRYGFLIPYTVKADVLFVLRVYRSTRKPLDYGLLTVP